MINSLKSVMSSHPKYSYSIEQGSFAANTSVDKILIMNSPGQCMTSTTNSYMSEKPETISIDPTYRRWFVLLIGLIPIIFRQYVG